ncbi:MAG: SGNH/GDSL hydrolase family protein [Actinomycetota bacterium]|nr:SGNH/GDSL hydrolase family protein [Actinomycetota bacterium]
MNLRRVACAMGLAVATIAATPAVASAGTTPADATTDYYVALGDSLSVGYQPIGPDHAGVETDMGYTDDLYTQLKARDANLVLVKLGCSGETTTSMLHGHTGSTLGACKNYQGDYSQVDAAVAFLNAHPGHVKYVTNDIGANDVDRCATAAGIDVACAVQGIATLSANLPQILGRLKAASGPAPITTGMNYYNPLLASYLTGSKGMFLAAVSSLADFIVNTIEENEYRAFGWGVADVSGAFQSYDYFTQKTLPPPVGTVPLNVYNICTLTWMCTLQNIHANNAGYQVIANAFAAVLPKVTVPA